MAPQTHPSRAHLLPRSSKSKRKQKPDFITGSARPKAHKVTPFKRRIRDVTRLLQRDPASSRIPANKRVELERELQGLQKQLRNEELEIKRKELIGRYHMVRFFERKRAQRNLGKAKAALSKAESEESSDVKECEALVHTCEVDLAYTKYHPLMVPYVSLYPKSAQSSTDDEDDSETGAKSSIAPVQGAKGDVEMWKRVEQALNKGQEALDKVRGEMPQEEAAEADQDDEDEQPRPKKTKTTKKIRSKTSSNGRLADGDHHMSDSDSDGGGGFFE